MRERRRNEVDIDFHDIDKCVYTQTVNILPSSILYTGSTGLCICIYNKYVCVYYILE